MPQHQLGRVRSNALNAHVCTPFLNTAPARSGKRARKHSKRAGGRLGGRASVCDFVRVFSIAMAINYVNATVSSCAVIYFGTLIGTRERASAERKHATTRAPNYK